MLNNKEFAEYIKKNATALATTYEDAIGNLPSTYYAVVYIYIPKGVDDDYVPEREETVVTGKSTQDAEENFYKTHRGLHENGYRYGYEVQYIENYTIRQAANNNWDL